MRRQSVLESPREFTCACNCPGNVFECRFNYAISKNDAEMTALRACESRGIDVSTSFGDGGLLQEPQATGEEPAKKERISSRGNFRFSEIAE